MDYNPSYQPDIAIHPGKTLSDNLSYLNISQTNLAQRTGMTEKHISQIVNEKAGITPETAIKLEKALGINASFWNNLEKNYQLALARIKFKQLCQKDIPNLVNFKETYKDLTSPNYNIISKKYRWTESNFEQILLQLYTFFGSTKLDFYQDILKVCAYRKYKTEQNNSRSLAAWLRLGEIKSQHTKTQPYSKKKLEDSLQQIQKLALRPIEESIQDLEDTLAECGIVLACAPGFTKTYTQGATRWLSSSKVVIILKSYKQGEDKFWFNLFHEIGHILLHGSKKTFIDLEDDINSDEEIEANHFAQKQLLPSFATEDLSQYNLSDEKSLAFTIKKLASKHNTSISIMAGQVAYRTHKSLGKNIYPLVNHMIKRVNISTIPQI